MTVKELYNKLEYQINRGRDNLKVVIKTSNKSIGASSSIDVKDIFAGFDWDANTLFISPEVELVRKDLNRDVILEPVKFGEYCPALSDPCNYDKLICRNCETRVSKNDNYCKRCGQKLKD